MGRLTAVGLLCCVSLAWSSIQNPPIAAATMPKPGFPAATAALTNAQWPGGTQPPTLDAWPKAANGDPLPCWKTQVLRDHASGWAGQCLGLTTQPGATKADCASLCQKDPTCAVWQFNTGTGCFHGQGKDCNNRAANSLIPVVGAQRLQHGDVTVMKKLGSMQILHLYNYGVYGNGNSTVGTQRCRAYCYSDIFCQYWQYGTGGCWVEHPKWQTFNVQYPLTTNGGADASSTWAKTIVDGEYIQHSCPPPPPPAAPPAPPAAPVAPVAPAAPVVPAAPSAPWWPWVLGALLLLAALAALAFCLMRSPKKTVKKTRGVPRGRPAPQPQPVDPPASFAPLYPTYAPQPSFIQQPMMPTYQQAVPVQTAVQVMPSYQQVAAYSGIY